VKAFDVAMFPRGWRCSNANSSFTPFGVSSLPRLVEPKDLRATLTVRPKPHPGAIAIFAASCRLANNFLSNERALFPAAAASIAPRTRNLCERTRRRRRQRALSEEAKRALQLCLCASPLNLAWMRGTELQEPLVMTLRD
jgi:hypothetical protein